MTITLTSAQIAEVARQGSGAAEFVLAFSGLDDTMRDFELPAPEPGRPLSSSSRLAARGYTDDRYPSRSHARPLEVAAVPHEGHGRCLTPSEASRPLRSKAANRTRPLCLQANAISVVRVLPAYRT